MTWKETRSVSTDSICTLAQQEGYSNWHEDCGEAWFCVKGADEGIGASSSCTCPRGRCLLGARPQEMRTATPEN